MNAIVQLDRILVPSIVFRNIKQLLAQVLYCFSSLMGGMIRPVRRQEEYKAPRAQPALGSG